GRLRARRGSGQGAVAFGQPLLQAPEGRGLHGGGARERRRAVGPRGAGGLRAPLRCGHALRGALRGRGQGRQRRGDAPAAGGVEGQGGAAPLPPDLRDARAPLPR
ncbi:MAG: hypothetical protein AVDCRST_MAG25-3319, partial [uncultured Rubrobacteraceae bacterium]